MKHILKFAAIAALAFGITAVRAEDKAVTLSGEGKCAKCALHKADKCQNVVEVKNGDKTTIYYLTGDVSKAFHGGNLCSGAKQVTVTGVPSEKDGKMELAVTKIEAK
jgi:Family of unknown function (DUF6370)